MRDLIKFAGKIRRMPVGEMTAVREIHRENFVARLNRGEIDRHIGLRTAVRLDVDMLGAKESFRAVDGQLFGHIDIFTAAIPAFARVTFGVLVREHAALRFHHRAAGEVFRRNQLNIFALPFFFCLDRVENLGIDFL